MESALGRVIPQNSSQRFAHVRRIFLRHPCAQWQRYSALTNVRRIWQIDVTVAKTFTVIRLGMHGFVVNADTDVFRFHRSYDLLSLDRELFQVQQRRVQMVGMSSFESSAQWWTT